MGKSKRDLLSNALQGSPASLMLNEEIIKSTKINEKPQEIEIEPKQEKIFDAQVVDEIESPIDQESTIDSSNSDPKSSLGNSAPNLTLETAIHIEKQPIIQLPAEPIDSMYKNSVVSETMQPLTRKYIKTNPVKSKKVCYLITPYAHQGLERIAKDTGLSVNQLVNDIFNYFIEHYNK